MLLGADLPVLMKFGRITVLVILGSLMTIWMVNAQDKDAIRIFSIPSFLFGIILSGNAHQPNGFGFISFLLCQNFVLVYLFMILINAIRRLF